MGHSQTPEWSRLDSESEVPDFIDAAVELHRAIFDRLPPEERPHFFDYWLRLLNSSAAYLARRGGKARAFVTVPHRGGVHRYRWENATLAGDDLLRGDLDLPDEVSRDQAFLVSGLDRPGNSPPLPDGGSSVEIYRGYVRSLLDLDSRGERDDAWEIRAMAPEDLEPALELLRRSYATEEKPAPDLHVQREELRQTLESDAGWCWVASRGGSRCGHLCGVVSYVLLQVPLAGVPGALVSDLAVDPPQRHRGLARRLQHHAGACLGRAGQRWVFGNIHLENEASRRQAEALGRTGWYRSVRLGAIRSTD
jgi:ribosomal protein S18 acetylase RimI-like enzyme